MHVVPFLSEYAVPAMRRGLERGGLLDSLGWASWWPWLGLQERERLCSNASLSGSETRPQTSE